jgi:hypothetical protein
MKYLADRGTVLIPVVIRTHTSVSQRFQRSLVPECTLLVPCSILNKTLSTTLNYTMLLDNRFTLIPATYENPTALEDWFITVCHPLSNGRVCMGEKCP